MTTFTVYDFMGDVLYTGHDANLANAALARTEGMGWVHVDHPTVIVDTIENILDEKLGDFLAQKLN